MNERLLIGSLRPSTKSMPPKKMKDHFLRIANFLVRLKAHGQKI